MVEFCENCGAIIIGKKGEVVVCPSCGKENKSKDEIKLKQKINSNKETEVLDNIDASTVHPITQVECPECGAKEAYYWTKQTRAGDEPETQFFKCTECSHQWRNYK